MVQHGQHLKALAVVKSPLIVKKKTKGALANSIPNLPLPEETSRDIGRSSNQSIIRTLGGVLWLTKVILDNVVHIQIRFGVLDERKLERLQRPKRNRSGREDQLRRRRSWGRSNDYRRRWRRSRNSDARRSWRRRRWNCHRRVGLKKGNKRCSKDTLLSYGLELVHALVAYPSCATCREHLLSSVALDRHSRHR